MYVHQHLIAHLIGNGENGVFLHAVKASQKTAWEGTCGRHWLLLHAPGKRLWGNHTETSRVMFHGECV